jgi:hypothetical protein
MIFDPKYTYLYVFERTGAYIHTTVETIVPIQMALAAQGGTVKLLTYFVEHYKTNFYEIRYETPCQKIGITFRLTKEEYVHNLEFFGENITTFDPKAKFDLDGNKFKMP